MEDLIRVTGRTVYVHRTLVEQVQAEIDELIASDPEAHPIDAATLIALEMHGYTWDFENGDVEDHHAGCE